MLEKNRQKGAILVLTAFLLPLLLAATGCAIDFGNLYYQKSRLQNAADAAALAGAHQYVKVYETKHASGAKTAADALADEYIIGGHHNLQLDEAVEIQHELKLGKKQKYYYIVTISKAVPLYFLQIFLSEKEATVSAHSNAVIYSNENTAESKENKMPPHLFVFSRQLTGVNSIDSPDNFDLAGKIITTFDGSVVYTDPNHEPIQYSTQTDKLQEFFTKRARDEGLSVNEARKRDGSVYDTTAQGAERGEDTKHGYWHRAQYLENFSYDELGKQILSPYTEEKHNIDHYDQKHQDFYQNAVEASDHLQKYDSGNINLTIFKEIQGNIDQPVVIEAPQYGSVINVNLYADTRRPIIIYSPGAMQIHVNLNGHTFRGIVFAPNINDEGVLVNANGGIFSGSIVAKTINLQGGKGTYRYENVLGGSASGGSSGSKGGISFQSSGIQLVSDRDMDV